MVKCQFASDDSPAAGVLREIGHMAETAAQDVEAGEALVQHLLHHGEHGYEWEPLDQDDWMRKAGPALEAQA